MKHEDFKEIMASIDVDIEGYDENEVIRLHDEIEADIVYETPRRGWLKYLLVIPALAIVFVLFLGVVYLSQVRLVPHSNVVGAVHEIAGFSIVPSTYRADPSDMIPGSTVIIAGESDFIGPFLLRHETARVARVSDQFIYVEQEGTKDLRRVPVFDVIYVIGKG